MFEFLNILLNPAFDLFIILLIAAGFFAWKGLYKYALLGVGAAMWSFAADAMYPPFSALDFALPGTEWAAKALQPVRLSDDLTAGFWIRLFPNFKLFDITLPQPVPLFVIAAIPIMLVLISLIWRFIWSANTDIAIEIASFALFTLLIYWNLDGDTATHLYFTMAGAFALVIVPAVFWWLGTKVLITAAKRIS